MDTTYRRQLALLSLLLSTTLCLSLGLNETEELSPLTRHVRQASCVRMRYRTIDGSCNNAANPNWGQTGSPYLRFLPPDYSDGRSAPRESRLGNGLPAARIVSLSMAGDANNEHQAISHMLMQWGQLINHDLSKKRTKDGKCCDDGNNPNSNSADCLPIMMPSDDPVLRKRCFSFMRSDSVNVNGHREQLNDVSGYLDASAVYGSKEGVSRSLRTFRGGQLKVLSRPGSKGLLPTMQSDSSSFASGDSRTNMIPTLVVIHAILVREHNRIAEELQRMNPQWDDETVFQEARRIVAAEMQQITYREYLPRVIGQEGMRSMQLQDSGYSNSYNPSINPSVSNGFAVAAYRYGHSLVQSHLKRMTPDMRELPSPPLAREFFNVSSIMNNPGEMDLLTMGLITQRSQNADSKFTNQIQHHLFGEGMDLYAINIQRGRDHGIPPYGTWREFCGLPPLRDFSDLEGVMRPESIRALQRLYSHPNDADLYAAGMAELNVRGGLVGPTFSCVIGRQFHNLKHGDRYWYENGGEAGSFTPEQLNEVRKATLAKIVCDNSDSIRQIQPNIMEVPGPSNPMVPCNNLPAMDLSAWAEGNNQLEPHFNPQFQQQQQQQQQQQRPFGPQPQQVPQRPFSPQIQQQPQRPFGPQEEVEFIPRRQQPKPQRRPPPQRPFSPPLDRPSGPFISPDQGLETPRQPIQRPQQGTGDGIPRPVRPFRGRGKLRTQKQQQQQSQNVGFRGGFRPQPQSQRPFGSQSPPRFRRPLQQSLDFPQEPLQQLGAEQNDNLEPLMHQLVGRSPNNKAIRFFFSQQPGQGFTERQPLEHLIRFNAVKSIPGVVLRVPGLSKPGEESGTFGYIARF